MISRSWKAPLVRPVHLWRRGSQLGGGGGGGASNVDEIGEGAPPGVVVAPMLPPRPANT